MSSTAKILAKGSALRMIEFFSTAFVTLAMTPFIIHSLGDATYGLWIFVGSFLGYYGLMDFGLNSAIQRFLSRAIGINDKHEANKVINTAFAIFAIIGFITLIFSFAIAFVFPLLIKNITEVNLFRKIILILGLNFAIGFPLRVFSGILSANIRYDLSTMVELIKLAIRTTLIIVLLKAGYGIMALAIITTITDIIGYACKYFIVKRLYKHLVFSKKLIDVSKIGVLFRYSFYTFTAQIADQLKFNIDNLVIISFIGLSSVTVYSIAFRLIKYFSRFITAAIGIFVPVFSQYEARGDSVSIRNKFILSTKISGYISVFIGGALIIFGKAFIYRWMGEKYLSAYPILIILTISFTLGLMQTPSIQLFYGLSKHKYFAVTSIIEGVLNLILSIALIKNMGLIGVALGTAIPMIIGTIFIYPPYVCRLVKLKVWEYYFQVLFPILTKSSLFIFVFWWLARGLISPNYIQLITLIAFLMALFTAFSIWTGFVQSERHYFKKTIFNTV